MNIVRYESVSVAELFQKSFVSRFSEPMCIARRSRALLSKSNFFGVVPGRVRGGDNALQLHDGHHDALLYFDSLNAMQR